MYDVVGIDVGHAIPYAIERILQAVGKDDVTKDFHQRLDRQIRIATAEAWAVQCVGMHTPIAITKIYQPVKLRLLTDEDSIASLRPIRLPPPFDEEELDDEPNGGSGNAHEAENEKKNEKNFEEVLASGENAVIFAGAGQGKSTLLHWAYTKSLKSAEFVPILYTLRRPQAVNDLEELVAAVAKKKTPRKVRDLRMILLVDGYDEIAREDRKRVSSALLDFSQLGVGNYVLTCRNFYDVYDLIAPQYELLGFSRGNAEEYVRAFSDAYGTKINAGALISELEEHHFGSFVEHPLLLALVCILKSRPMPTLPRNMLGLIRRAVDTLTLRWDEAKGISRESSVPLDGDERVRCLMRIAYRMILPIAPEDVIHKSLMEQLKLAQRTDIDLRTLLTEIAQFYGIFVPIGDGNWQFAHRTIHDYLAARFWVESGEFSPRRVSHWNSRAGYAASLVPDATESLELALKTSEGVSAFADCLYNNGFFDKERIAQAVVSHFQKYERAFNHGTGESGIEVETRQDFFDLASDEFLTSLLIASTRRRSPATDLVAAYSLHEMARRKKALAGPVYNQCRLLYSSERCRFIVKRKRGWDSLKLSALSPAGWHE